MELEKLWGDMTPTYFFKVELPDGIEVFCWLVEVEGGGRCRPLILV